MKLRFTLLITILIFSMTSVAQNLEWAKNIGSSGYDYGYKSVIDDSGNVYTTGYFIGIVDMDPSANTFSLTSLGGWDIFITKFNSSGNFVWAKRIGGSGKDFGLNMAIGSLGNVYITGFYSDTVDFDPGTSIYNLSSVGGNDIFVLKLDGSGNLKWAKSMGGSSLDWGFSIDVDNLGNVYTAGWFVGISDFDPGSSTYYQSASNQNIFVSKLDSNGNFVWAKNIGNSGVDNACNVYIDNSYNVILTGDFTGTVDFDPGIGNYNLTSSGNSDAFVLKLDSSGEISWTKSFGGSGDDRGYSIAMDNSYNIYITGYFNGNVDFDPGLGTYNLIGSGGQDVFISKLDSSGSFIWAKKFGGSGDERGRSLTTDIFGNVYVSGKFEGQVDFDPGLGTHILSSSAGSVDLFFAKLDSIGDFIWAWNFGDNWDDYCNDIRVDSSLNIYITGSYGGTVDFNPDTNTTYNLTSNGGMDIYIVKFSQCSNSSSVNAISACESYTSPSGKYIWTTSGTYKDTIQNAEGCDSIITIGLQINKITSDVVFKSACDSLISPSGKYTWHQSGSYMDTIQNSKGCDSTLIIGLVIHQESTSSLSDSACDYYVSPSGNYNWTQSGNYTDTLTNSAGCDSILNISLTIYQNVSISLSEKACSSYRSPSGKYKWTTSGIYYDTLKITNGCDTTFKINLSVNTVDDSVIATGNMSLKANALGAIYQWVDCNNAYAAIPGKSHQSFSASKSGSYAVIVSQFNCTDTSKCYQLINTATLENENNIVFNFYPNPAKNSLIIESTTNGILKIFNESGQIVYEAKSEKTRITHNISNLTNGLYIIQYIDDNLSISRKFIVFK